MSTQSFSSSMDWTNMVITRRIKEFVVSCFKIGPPVHLLVSQLLIPPFLSLSLFLSPKSSTKAEDKQALLLQRQAVLVAHHFSYPNCHCISVCSTPFWWIQLAQKQLRPPAQTRRAAGLWSPTASAARKKSRPTSTWGSVRGLFTGDPPKKSYQSPLQ